MAILVSLRLHRVILGLRDEIILLGCAASSSKHQRINPRTYMAARGRGWLPLLPPFFFLFFPQTVKHQLLPFSVTVRLSLAFCDKSNDGQLLWLRHNQQVVNYSLVKMHVFQLFSTVKVELVDEMLESAYLRVFVHVMNKKLPFDLISNSC